MKVERKQRRRQPAVLVSAVDSMPWLLPLAAELAERNGVSQAALFRIAFCEHFQHQSPELREKYRGWKKVRAV